MVQDLSPRPEIGRDPQDVARKLLLDGPPHRQIRREIGAAKSIDRLFGIAYQKQMAGLETPLVPCRGIVRHPAEQEQDLGLYRVGVLKLVYEYPGEAPACRRSHQRIAAQHVAAGEQQIVEIQDGRAFLESFVLGQHVVELGGERADDRRGDPAHQRIVSRAALRVMFLRLVSQAVSRLSSCRLSPQRASLVVSQVEGVLAHDGQPSRVCQFPEAFEVGQGIEASFEVQG